MYLVRLLDRLPDLKRQHIYKRMLRLEWIALLMLSTWLVLIFKEIMLL